MGTPRSLIPSGAALLICALLFGSVFRAFVSAPVPRTVEETAVQLPRGWRAVRGVDAAAPAASGRPLLAAAAAAITACALAAFARPRCGRLGRLVRRASTRRGDRCAVAAVPPGRGAAAARNATATDLTAEVCAAPRFRLETFEQPTYVQPHESHFLDDVGVSLDISARRFPWVAAVLDGGSVLVSANVVDCGSGSTRSISFTEELNVGGPSNMSRQKSEWRGAALAKALLDSSTTEELLQLLEEKLPDGPVLLGATAGVRHSLEVGDVTQEQVDCFNAALRSRLGERASLSILSGEEEARTEWAAVCHELSLTRLRHAQGSVAGAAPPEELRGMISGGGMSCQLAFAASVGDHGEMAAEQFFSFTNSVLKPGGLVERAAKGLVLAKDLNAEMAVHEANVHAAVQQLPAGQAGVFAMIEWAGDFIAGERSDRDWRMNMGYDRLHSRNEVLRAIQEHAISLWPTDPHEPVPRSAAVALLYCTVLRTTLRHAFNEDAFFYGMRSVNWATGHYLLTRQKMLHQLS